MSTIAVLPGDGIGPEVTRVAVEILRRVRPQDTHGEYLVGGAAYERHGTPIPDETKAGVERSDAVLFGAVGGPQWDGDRVPRDLRPEAALLFLRTHFELFANIRPVRVFPGLEDASTLKREVVEGLDLVVVRELTGGVYFAKPKEYGERDGIPYALDTMLYRKPEIVRILRVGFEIARTRRKLLHSVDKQNALETSRLWRKTAMEVAADYPDVSLKHVLVDNAAMQLVRNPKQFDVIVTENMFGDILSDEAAMLGGSIGNCASASLGRGGEPGRRFGLYEPISGSAPDIAGQNLANPTAAILSAAMLCRQSLDDAAAAERIERAVEAAFASGARTRDLAAAGAAYLSTTAFGEAVAARL
ncbi:MAG TPA: 3-isopropylmalate dehydrogenase [Candidatus Dormibacteraeota bacterium]|nr:3-isopropylmalate dehydrogenase [Candidatus Dormibacteraeota bacterium]